MGLLARRRAKRAATVDEGSNGVLDALLPDEASTTSHQPSAPQQATSTDTPAQAQESALAGWFPDPVTPDRIRYWDGSQWTNLVTPKPLPLATLIPEFGGGGVPDEVDQGPVAVQVAPGVEGPAPERNVQSSGWQSDPTGRHEGRYFDQGQPTNRVHDGSRFFFDEWPPTSTPTMPAEIAAAGATPPSARDWRPIQLPPPAAVGVGVSPPGAAASGAMAPGEEDPLVKTLAETIALARTADTAKCWAEAVQATTVVLEMVQAMLALAEARERVGEQSQAARAAVAAADAAKAEAERTIQVADELAEAARAAVAAADAAKAEAERAAQAVPVAAHAARVATDAAAEARRQAEALEEAAARARAAKTPVTWSDVLRPDAGRRGEAGTERVTYEGQDQ